MWQEVGEQVGSSSLGLGAGGADPKEWPGDAECAGRWDRGREAALGLSGRSQPRDRHTAKSCEPSGKERSQDLRSPGTLPQRHPCDYEQKGPERTVRKGGWLGGLTSPQEPLK